MVWESSTNYLLNNILKQHPLPTVHKYHSTIPVVVAKADSGALQHYFKTANVAAVKNCTSTIVGPTVSLLDGTTMMATHKGNLELAPTLTKKETSVHVFSGIENSSLLSIGQLCDDDCVAVLNKHKINI